MDLSLLGKTPISEDQPAGTDARYEPQFEALQAEIDKQQNPAASGGTDWKNVDKLASEILSTQSKDLLVASYLAVAQIHVRKLDGFAAGLRLYRDLLEGFWENLFPAKKRMRGRVAAIEWWIEKCQSVLQTLKPQPLPSETIETYRKDVKQIDTLLQEYLEDAPLLRPIERFIDSIPVVTEKKEESETPAETIPQPRTQPAPSPVVEPPKPAPAVETGEMASTSDADRALRAGFQSVRRAADYIQNQNLSDARGYGWRRVAGWSMIHALPPATEGRTEIPPPLQYEMILGELKGLKENGNWEALARAAEERFQGAILWLDLNRFTAEALMGLGDPYQDAHDAVCRETAYLIYRIPGIEGLSYADGTPFCDSETKQWLRSIGFGAGGGIPAPVTMSSGEGEDNPMAETVEKAKALVKKKKVGEAITLLQRELQSSFSKREQLMWRLELSMILLSVKKPQLALPHLESVLQDIEIYKLEEWDPRLAMQGLKMVWQGFNSVAEEAVKAQAKSVLNRIARLDPAEALNLA